MTRKRFIKLIMGFRVQRDSANKAADIALESHLSYSRVFQLLLDETMSLTANKIDQYIRYKISPVPGSKTSLTVKFGINGNELFSSAVSSVYDELLMLKEKLDGRCAV